MSTFLAYKLGTVFLRGTTMLIGRTLVIHALAVAACTVVPLVASGLASASRPAKGELPVWTDAQPEPFVPKRQPTPLEVDATEATTLFATGCSLRNHDRLPEALRHFQRALRLDPRAVSIARDIVRLAIALGRDDVAARYAVRLAQRDSTDAVLLLQLGQYLTDRGDLDTALTLYEKARAGLDKHEDRAQFLAVELTLARLHVLAEQFAEAADILVKAIPPLRSPEDFGLSQREHRILLGDEAESFRFFGETFLLADRFEESRAAFEHADEVEPDAVYLAVQLGRIASATDDRKKAVDHFARAWEIVRKQESKETSIGPADVLEQLVDALDAAERSAEAMSRLEKAHEELPNNEDIAYLLAARLDAGGKNDAAMAIYRELVSDAPRLIVYRRLIEEACESGDADAVLDILDDFVDRTSSLDGLDEQVAALADKADLRDRVLEEVSRRLAEDDTAVSFGLRLAAAWLAQRCGRIELADRFFDQALAVRNDEKAELLLLWGIGLLGEEDYARSARVFQRGIDEKVLDEGSPAFHFYLASTLAFDERYDEALKAARQAARLAPDAPRMTERVAWVLFMSERWEQAREAYQALIAEYDDDYTSQEIRLLMRESRFLLSSIAANLGRDDEAEAYLQEVLDEYPDDAGALNDLGYMWADANVHLHRAEPMIRRAVEQEPDNAAYQDSLGWVLYRRGRLQAAFAALQQALALQGDQPDAEILEHLGDVCRDLGRREEAKSYYERAFAAEQEDSEAAASEVDIDQRREEFLRRKLGPDESNEGGESTRRGRRGGKIVAEAAGVRSNTPPSK